MKIFPYNIIIRYQNINESMCSLDYKNEKTIERLEKSFQINYYWRIKIDSKCIIRKN